MPPIIKKDPAEELTNIRADLKEVTASLGKCGEVITLLQQEIIKEKEDRLADQKRALQAIDKLSKSVEENMIITKTVLQKGAAGELGSAPAQKNSGLAKMDIEYIAKLVNEVNNEQQKRALPEPKKPKKWYNVLY